MNRLPQGRKLAVIACVLQTYRNVLARLVMFLKLSVLPGPAVTLLLYAYAQVPPLPYGARGVLILGFLAAQLYRQTRQEKVLHPVSLASASQRP